VIGGGTVNVVTILQWEPFMDEFGECCAFSVVKSSKGKLYDLPMDSCRKGHCPLKFFLQVLEVLLLCGGVTKSGLQSADDNLSFDTEVGVANISVGILV